ncbi:endonuclease MutS2 [Ligilactobacillus equi]|uniref:Endonuclease MutS2 n=1 Tax=Ligilactobacillus equi DSM 15833 = JCM 10991 TaxID=1423740 RepID=A0A0R1TVQ7_9LACO|nr:endonuclease MutS2 [Ligilactobacillus equi]KRL85302.1 recombination and DNA strand exchange inhibitor protein [Ligilactobacillus equi DSM 15833 = JCM 10991]
MNQKVLATLEYYKIREFLSAKTTTEMGQNLANHLVPSQDYDLICENLAQTKEGADILRLKGGIPLANLKTVTPQLKRLKIGAVLNGKELAAIGKILRSTSEIRRFFKEITTPEVPLPTLNQLLIRLESLPELTKVLNLSLEDDGYVRDEASPLLRSLRRQISGTEDEIRQRLVSFTKGSQAKYLTNAVVTMRDDRYVIPVKTEYKKHFGGMVHDQSASGATVFVEPKAIVELNNRLRQQQAKEHEEILRVLRELSQAVAPYTEEIDQNMRILGQLDFVNAKARYAADLKATQPELSAENDIYLRQVWHPLLDAKKAVKNDLAIGKDYKAIVITGPNTGGKTITLKTLGLIQLMGQSGLFIPAGEHSRIGVFTEIFADIGDEQSIEQSLSTFSSHMVNIVEILKHVDDKSLVLFDELGAGTDPQEGAALAISILDAVGAKGSYVVATTHYPELKAYGFERPETINASMEFDVETLQPTYRLLLGIPGRSNALEISLRLGLDTMVVEAARQLTSQSSQDLNEMIADLVEKRHTAEEEAISLNKYLTEAEKLHNDLRKAYNNFVSQRDSLLNQAKAKANEIVENTRKQTADVISDLHKMQQSAGNGVKENELIDAKTRLNKLEQPIHLQKNKVLQRAKAKKIFKEGDEVLVKSYGQRGTLMKKAGNHVWEVQIGILKMKLDEADLEKIAEEKPQKTVNRASVKRSRSVRTSASLDLRGKRYEEAMNEVDRYIDEAIMAGFPSVTIIHGKGTGALRKGITEYLQSNRAVKHFEYAPPNAGGNGATIVSFK